VHAVKIDRAFVSGLVSGGRDATIVASVLSLGRDLDLSVVAEGIETVEERDALLDLGCVYGQGFLFSRPQPPEAIDLELLATP
jgi:EAL domain-containing protein (putative c-di-GMP-specific phosphodiesterase class I)